MLLLYRLSALPSADMRMRELYTSCMGKCLAQQAKGTQKDRTKCTSA